MPMAAIRTRTSPARGSSSVDLMHLERPPLLVEDGRAGDHSSAAFTSAQVVTVETFCSA